LVREQRVEQPDRPLLLAERRLRSGSGSGCQSSRRRRTSFSSAASFSGICAFSSLCAISFYALSSRVASSGGGGGAFFDPVGSVALEEAVVHRRVLAKALGRTVPARTRKLTITKQIFF